MISFDQILDNHIQTGLHQIETIIIIGLVEFCDGIEYAFMSILMSVLRSELNLTTAEVASLGSFYLAGNVLGHYFCAYVSDIIGRKVTFSTFCGIAIIIVYGVSFAQTLLQIVILRFLLGIVVGATNPLGYVFITEVSVSKYRGRFAFIMTLMFVIGKIYLTCLCFVFLDDYSSGNWRGLVRFNGIPLIICFISSMLFLRETVRYYLNLCKFSEAFKEIETLHRLNHRNEQQQRQLTTQEKDGLIQWQQRLIRVNKSHQGRASVLSKEFTIITLKLWGLAILYNIQNLSIYLLMPFLFAAHSRGFEAMLYLFVVEFCFVFLLYFLIDNPKYGGRIKVILLSASLLTIANISLLVFKENVLFFGMLLIKLTIRAILSTIYVVTCESYPLSLRAKANGLTQAVGKLATIPAPYLIFPLFFYSNYLPFAFLSVASILMIVIAYSFGEDRTQKHLEESSLEGEQGQK